MRYYLKAWSFMTVLVLTSLLSLSGCTQNSSASKPDGEVTGKKFAIVTKSSGNENMKKMVKGFESVIKEKGGTEVILGPLVRYDE